MKLTGKVAIVTGTSPNIGGGLAEGLAEEGATRRLRGRGRRTTPGQCAECDPGRRRPGPRHRLRHHRREPGGGDGRPGAGGLRRRGHPRQQRRHPGRAQRARDAARALEAPDRGQPHRHVPLHQARRPRHGRAKARGSIMVVVSTAGHQGQAGNIAYCTSKSGLLNFTRAAAMDLARHGIRVNSLTPTATDMEEGRRARGGVGPPARPSAGAGCSTSRRWCPMGQLPSPRHYARAVGLPGLRRRGDDHRLRPARRRGRDREVLALDSRLALAKASLSPDARGNGGLSNIGVRTPARGKELARDHPRSATSRS